METNFFLTQLPILIVILPLFAGFFTLGIGYFNKKYCVPLAIVGMGLSAIFSIATLDRVIKYGPQRYFLSGWPAPFGIEYVVDHLNAIVLVLVATCSLLTLIFSLKSVEKELKNQLSYFYTLFLFLVTGLLGITISGDAFNIYVLLEIAALSSYGLLALGKGRSYLATFNYLIVGTIGACLYLLGVGFLLIKTGTLNMGDLAFEIESISYSSAIFIAFILMVVGMFVKMAFFPAHGWLANVYSLAPTAVGCLIAPLMTKVSVYVLARILFTVFSASYLLNALYLSEIVLILAVVAIAVGSFYALMQQNLRKLFCFLIVAEIGYMVGGLFLGNAAAFRGAIYHLIADGMMTLCLFMCAGAIYYQTGNLSLDSCKGLFKNMPITMSVFTLAAFSMIGVPPTAGFFSKWFLISGSFYAGNYSFIIALLFSSLINAILFFRIIENAFYGSFESTKALPTPKEAPLSMLIPMVIMASLIVLWGLYSGQVIDVIIDPINPFIGAEQ